MIARDFGPSLGQHFFMGLSGFGITPEERKILAKRDIGGVIIFSRNIESREQLQELCRELRATDKDSSSHIPLFIAIDMEGGRVARLKPPFPTWPPLATIADESGINQFFSERLVDREKPAKILETVTGTELVRITREKAYAFANTMGRELVDLGFNLNFAPTLDVLTNPENKIIGDRAVSQHAEVVARIVPDLIRGYTDAGILSCGKHAPGHGNTLLDSHFELPVEQEATRASLGKRELLPFKAAITASISMLMTAHVLYPHLDPDEPATISRKIIQNIVREDLRFEGAVCTDDMDMKALANRYPSDARAVKALHAGCDLLLFCNEPQSFEIAYEGVKKFAVDRMFGTDSFSEQKNDLSLRRILTLKKRI